MENFLKAVMQLLNEKACKPIELWSLCLLFLKGLPDDHLDAFKADLHHLTEVAGQRIMEDIPDSAYHKWVGLQSLALTETRLLVERNSSAVSETLVAALHDDQWAAARQLAQERMTPARWSAVFRG